MNGKVTLSGRSQTPHGSAVSSGYATPTRGKAGSVEDVSPDQNPVLGDGHRDFSPGVYRRQAC